MSKVSIIVSAYNVEKYIIKCIDTLLSQSLRDIQIIVVNDGSTDSTLDLIKEYSDSRILLLTKENGGLSDARNYGIKYAIGEYISFVDGDDFVESCMYEELYNCAILNNSDVVECSYFMDYPDKTKVKHVRDRSSDDLRISPYNAWNKLIKTSILKEAKLEFIKGYWYEDLNFFLKLNTKIFKTSIIDKPLYHYIQRDGSIMHTVSNRINEIFTVLDDDISYYQKRNISLSDDIKYFIIKELLISSFKRFSLYDKQNRTYTALKNLEYLNEKIPEWKKIKQVHKFSLVNIYLITFNRLTYKIYKKIIGVIK